MVYNHVIATNRGDKGVSISPFRSIVGLSIWNTGNVLAAILSLRIGNRLGRGMLGQLVKGLHPASTLLHGVLFVFSGVTGGALGEIIGGGSGGGFIGLFSALMDIPTDLWTNRLLWPLSCAIFGSLIGGLAGAAVGVTASAIEGYTILQHAETDQLP